MGVRWKSSKIAPIPRTWNSPKFQSRHEKDTALWIVLSSSQSSYFNIILSIFHEVCSERFRLPGGKLTFHQDGQFRIEFGGQSPFDHVSMECLTRGHDGLLSNIGGQTCVFIHPMGFSSVMSFLLWNKSAAPAWEIHDRRSRKKSEVIMWWYFRNPSGFLWGSLGVPFGFPSIPEFHCILNRKPWSIYVHR